MFGGRFAAIVLAAVVLAPLSSGAHAQTGVLSTVARPHTVAGVVLDPTGAAVADAELTLTDPAGSHWNGRTGPDGHFAVRADGRGPYTATSS